MTFFKKHILIGTTAINRPELHADIIPGWYNFIRLLDPNRYSVNWFINIDYIPQLESSISDTEDVLRNCIPDIPIHFVHKQNSSGNFLTACKTLTRSITEFVTQSELNPNDVIIFWLEDDWKINPSHIKMSKIIETYLSNMSIVNLSFIRNNYLHALAPGIMNYRLFLDLHVKAWMRQVDQIDPEHCVGKLSILQYGPYENIQNITIINKYKTITDSFFNQSMLSHNTSYYTYDSDVNVDTYTRRDNYITPEQIVQISHNVPTFIRITCSSCIGGCNYGREFMKTREMIKTRTQTNHHKEFYKKS